MREARFILGLFTVISVGLAVAGLYDQATYLLAVAIAVGVYHVLRAGRR